MKIILENDAGQQTVIRTITTLEQKILNHWLRDIGDWIKGALDGKIVKRATVTAREELARLKQEGATAAPLDEVELCKLTFQRPGYQTRLERDAADDAAAAAKRARG